jgi:hypothetical protein
MLRGNDDMGCENTYMYPTQHNRDNCYKVTFITSVYIIIICMLIMVVYYAWALWEEIGEPTSQRPDVTTARAPYQIPE